MAHSDCRAAIGREQRAAYGVCLLDVSLSLRSAHDGDGFEHVSQRIGAQRRIDYALPATRRLHARPLRRLGTLGSCCRHQVAISRVRVSRLDRKCALRHFTGGPLARPLRIQSERERPPQRRRNAGEIRNRARLASHTAYIFHRSSQQRRVNSRGVAPSTSKIWRARRRRRAACACLSAHARSVRGHGGDAATRRRECSNGWTCAADASSLGLLARLGRAATVDCRLARRRQRRRRRRRGGLPHNTFYAVTSAASGDRKRCARLESPLDNDTTRPSA